ncbi:MAG TPA: hypothetical protein VM901_10665 [Bdellovibrionota bacterium]|nr:hypothetical protein [Bdellovibrionota bacterium]
MLLAGSAWAHADRSICHFYFELLRGQHPAAASNRFAEISDVIRAPENILPRPFDPSEVLARKGLDPSLLRFKVHHVPSYGFPTEPMVVIYLQYPEGTPAGHIYLRRHHLGDGLIYRAQDIKVRHDFKNRGLGTLLYLSAAIYLQNSGAELVSAPHKYLPMDPHWWLRPGHSPEAERTWVNLVRNGYASEWRTDTDEGHMIYYLLRSENFGELLQPTREFFESRLLDTP